MTARILFITGTDTDVGKTITTAAVATVLPTLPGPGGIAVYKPIQTGVGPAESGDIEEVRRLSRVESVSEGLRLRQPMAPVAAARRDGVRLPTLDTHAARIRQLLHQHDRVVVEGAGGLLVQLDEAGHSLADLAGHFGAESAVIVVCRSGLGTLNHTELTLEALRSRDLPVAGIVIGSWPHNPDEIALDNRRYLSALPVPLIAAIPERSSRLDPDSFRSSARAWFTRLP